MGDEDLFRTGLSGILEAHSGKFEEEEDHLAIQSATLKLIQKHSRHDDAPNSLRKKTRDVLQRSLMLGPNNHTPTAAPIHEELKDLLREERKIFPEKTTPTVQSERKLRDNSISRSHSSDTTTASAVSVSKLEHLTTSRNIEQVQTSAKNDNNHSVNQNSAPSNASGKSLQNLTEDVSAVIPAVMERFRRPRLLLCASGSVAAVKVPQLAKALAKTCQVRVCLTNTARHFVFEVSKSYDPDSWQRGSWQQRLAQPDWSAVYLDEDEWRYKKVGEPVLHIELRKWADIMVIAPASANTLGKIANGLCNNLVTCIARAWDPVLPMILCPAMNTYMWKHPLTENHIGTLRDTCGYRILEPVSRRLACGDIGKGAMVPVEMIVAAVRDEVNRLVINGKRTLTWSERIFSTFGSTSSMARVEALSLDTTSVDTSEETASLAKRLVTRIVDSPSASGPMFQEASRNSQVHSDTKEKARNTKEGSQSQSESMSGCNMQ